MRRLIEALPTVVVVALTLVASLPWELPQGQRFLLPLLPMLGIVHFALVRPALMPTGVAFACGLTLDAVTFGPLGFWAMVNVVSKSLAVGLAPASAPSLAVRAGLLVLILVAMSLLGWGIANVAVAHSIDWRSMAGAAALAAVLYPALAWALRPLDRALHAEAGLRLQRGE